MSDDLTMDRVRHELPGLSYADAEELASVVDRLVRELGAVQVFVFGSRARGDEGEDSDIDLLVVVPTADQPSYRLAQAAYRIAAPHSLDLEILVMSREEFLSRSRALASLPATVLREGRVLYAA